jgi:hypothetical protein
MAYGLFEPMVSFFSLSLSINTHHFVNCDLFVLAFLMIASFAFHSYVAMSFSSNCTRLLAVDDSNVMEDISERSGIPIFATYIFADDLL